MDINNEKKNQPVAGKKNNKPQTVFISSMFFEECEPVHEGGLMPSNLMQARRTHELFLFRRKAMDY